MPEQRSASANDIEPPSTIVAHTRTINNNNLNQNTVYGSANTVNSNPNFNFQSSSGASVHYHLVTNIVAPASGEETLDADRAKITAALKERFVPQAVYDAQLNPGCMDHTRVRILGEIEAWIMDPESQRICWISGVAGSGKTSVAKTVCQRANANAEIMLGGSFFCSRSSGLAAQRDIRCVIPTLTQLLVLRSVESCLALTRIIDPGTQYKEVKAQIEQLLHPPLMVFRGHHVPILFVIDALDECSGETSDGMLDEAMCHAVVTSMLEALVVLTQSDPRLPVKFLVTSRPETQIRDTSISDENFSHILRLHAADANEVNADISRYITTTLHTKLSNHPRLRSMITDGEVEHLVRLCNGLFIVAATALKHTFGAGADAAVAKFKRLLNASGDSLSTGVSASLDSMYTAVMEDAVRADTSEATQLSGLLRLISSLLSTRTMLSVTSLTKILNLELYDVRASFSRLHAVIHVPEDDDVPELRIVHASFGDYLLARAPNHIRIPRSLGHYTLAHACLDVMRRQLHFNISKIASSYERQPSVRPDCITPVLEYACLHWAHHLSASLRSDLADSDLLSFDAKVGLEFRPKFLFWLEVLSVMRKVNRASGILLIAGSAVRDSALSQFLRDANLFVASSHSAIERNAAHIYLSALPFADKNSLVYQDFSPHCIGLITVDTFGIARHSGSVVMTLTGHSKAVRSATYSANGCLLASGSDDGTVRVWEIQTGEEIMSPLCSGNGSVLTVDFAPNNKWIASGTESGVVCVWNVMQGIPSCRRLSGHSAQVNSVAFKFDSSRLVSVSEDQTVRLWDPDTGEQYAVQSSPVGQVDIAGVSRYRMLLSSNSSDVIPQIVLFSTGKPSVFGPKNIGTIDCSPDGEMVAKPHGNCVGLHKRISRQQAALLQGTDEIRFVRFSSDGRSLVAANGRNVRLWTLHPDLTESPGVDLSGHGGNINCAIFSPDNRYVVSVSDDTTIRIWNAECDQSDAESLSTQVSSVNSVAVSHDGTSIASGSVDCSVRVWNAYTGEEMFPPLHGHQDTVNSVKISSDGRLIASASWDGTIRLWDAQLGAPIGNPMRGHTKNTNAVVFSHDGCRLASASSDYTVRMWEVATQQPISVGPLQCTNSAYAVAFSPDGELVAAGDLNNRIYLWRTNTGERKQTLLQTSDGYVQSLEFSPDGTRIVSSGSEKVVRIWDVSTGRTVLELQGHTTSVQAVAWSFNGEFIGTGSYDNTVCLWNASTGTPLVTLHGHTGQVTSVTFTSNGEYIVSSSTDSTIRKWNVKMACKLAAECSTNPVAALVTARLENGWLVGPSDELLLWTPAEYRGYLQTALCTLMISGRRVAITAGDSGILVGSEWSSCWHD